MLDLNFVRDNLPVVEEKLRQRGMDPAEVLKDFQEVDTQRRQAITEAETSKAQRNRASEEIAKLKKSGQDASAQMAETKELREQIQKPRKPPRNSKAACTKFWPAFPILPHASVPVGKSAEDNVEVRRWGAPPEFDFTPKAHWDLGSNWAFSIWNAPRNFPARASPCIGIWERSWSGRWPISCSICTLASMATRKFCRRIW